MRARTIVLSLAILAMPLFVGGAAAKLVTCTPSTPGVSAVLCDRAAGDRSGSCSYGETDVSYSGNGLVTGRGGGWWDCGHCTTCYWEERTDGATGCAVVECYQAGWMHGNGWGCEMGMKVYGLTSANEGTGCPLGQPPASEWGHVLP